MNRICKCIAAIGCVLLCLLSGGCRETSPDTLEIHMLEVGNADCFLLKLGEKAMLIDGGEADDADKIVSYLHAQGVERLEAVVISHPHSDHIGGLERVFKAYDVKTLYFAQTPSELTETTLLHTRLEDAVRDNGAEICDATDGVACSFGKAIVELYPMTVTTGDANDYSLCARVTFGNERILFTGDAGESAQRALLNSGFDIQATIVKMGHHGGQIKTNERFLDAVEPQIALISCGIENTYKHPHQETIELLEKRGIACYRTDVGGDTVIELDGKGERFITTAR